jgi:hypothetical protein
MIDSPSAIKGAGWRLLAHVNCVTEFGYWNMGRVYIDHQMDTSGVHNECSLFVMAAGFRDALLACPKDESSGFQRRRLSTFPKQCCDVASLLLAYRLRDLGFPNIVRCFGHLEGESHVWLEVDRWIVDITADQFPGVEDPVIMAEIGRSPFHAQIALPSRGPAYALPAVPAEYDRAYAAIKSWCCLNDSAKAGK